MFQIKQYNTKQYEVCEWQLEEAQVFWAKKEESLALNILKGLIKKLDADWFQVCAIWCVNLWQLNYCKLYCLFLKLFLETVIVYMFLLQEELCKGFYLLSLLCKKYIYIYMFINIYIYI